jgi:effector-binding domain-containing protein
MPTTTPELIEVDEQTTAVIRGQVPMAELPAFFDRVFGTLPQVLERQGVAPTGPAFARYHGPPGEVADLEVGFPTATSIAPDGEVVPSALPAGRVARTVHAGSFDGLGESWGALAGWAAEQGEAPGDVMWEVYVTEPSPDMDPAELRTELNWTLA